MPGFGQRLRLLAAVPDDIAEHLRNPVHIWRLSAQEAQSSLRVHDRCGDRLVDLMSNRSRQLPHRGYTIGVREFHHSFAVFSLAFASFGFCALAFGQIEDEGYPLISTFLEHRRADQDGHARTIFSEVLLLE
jgi:hypothetical protein